MFSQTSSFWLSDYKTRNGLSHAGGLVASGGKTERKMEGFPSPSWDHKSRKQKFLSPRILASVSACYWSSSTSLTKLIDFYEKTIFVIITKESRKFEEVIDMLMVLMVVMVHGCILSPNSLRCIH